MKKVTAIIMIAIMFLSFSAVQAGTARSQKENSISLNSATKTEIRPKLEPLIHCYLM